jgi:DNA helicase HerA-like ATPase
MPFETGNPTRAAMNNTLSSFFRQAPHLKGGDWYDYTRTTYDEFLAWIDSFNAVEFEANDLAQENSMTDGMWGAMLRRFKRPEFERVFDSGAQRITDNTDALVRPGQVSIVPTSHLDPMTEKLVVMSLMSLVVENKVGSSRDKNIYETPLILTVDEAHNFLSDSDNLQDQYIVNKFNQVAKQGRKYKLGMFNISQTPEDINDGILKQSNSKIYLGLEPEVLSSIPVPDGFQHKIPNFGKGQAVVKAPDVKATEIQGLNVCLTKHSD